MSATSYVKITCDFKEKDRPRRCRAEFWGLGNHNSLLARREMQEYGWSHEGILDYCSFHTIKRAEEALL